MNLFHEIMWWFGALLGGAAIIMFYSMLTMGLYLYVKEKFGTKKKS